MWLDCSANFKRFSYPDSIKYYVAKCHEIGITHLVLDIKDNTGEVLYPSKYATQKKEWKGFVRPDFDYISLFADEAHKYGMTIFAGLNVFADGHNFFKRGDIYNKHSKWQCTNYLPLRGLTPITEIKEKMTMFLNPALKAVQKYEINIIKEVLYKYNVDGIMLDRARYDCIESDFSPESRVIFEKYIGKKLNKYPEDIYEWKKNSKGETIRVPGMYYKEWLEWRASVIYNFVKDVRETVKKIKPNCIFATYTGAWYPSYFEVGVNWASKKYDPSKDFNWATPNYKNYGYAELFDFYTNGNYYWNVSLEDYYKSSGKHKNETDSEVSSGEYLSVEGGCKYTRYLLQGANPFYGGLYVEDYKHDKDQFKKAVRMNLKESDGVMIFDIVHIINRNWWNELKEALNENIQADNSLELTGTVSCEGNFLPDVVVSDGIRCVKTDKNGVYHLPYIGDTRFVYVTTPAGYLPDCSRSIPLFYHEIDTTGKQRKYDFVLHKNPNDDKHHILIQEADVQANNKEHWAKYAQVVNDCKRTTENYPNRDIFAITCGDIGWDIPNTFFQDYIAQAEKLPIPIYRVMGNHDMDCNGRTHETSYRTFEKYFGPSHYSFNRGNAHYIVINNNFYIGREYFYIGYIDEHTFRWLEQDLAYVPKGSPVFLAAHIPIRLSSNSKPFQYDYNILGGETTNAEALLKLLDEYDTHLLTGHMHTNTNVIFNDHQMEHNVAAACGTWWRTNICPDGTPQGYAVYEIDGNNIKWYYKSVAHSKNFQMNVFPPGTIKEYHSDIIANVWNWDNLWKVEWLENGKVIGQMKQFKGIDPNAKQAISNHKGKMENWISALPTDHIFHAAPHNPHAKLEVRVTDRFGQIYQQTVHSK